MVSIDTNWLTRAIGLISPFKYSSEIFMSILLHGLAYKDEVLEQFSFVVGLKECKVLCVLFVLAYFFLGWGAINYQSKRYV